MPLEELMAKYGYGGDSGEEDSEEEEGGEEGEEGADAIVENADDPPKEVRHSTFWVT